MPSIVFDPPRELTPEERDILDFLVEANVEHRDALRPLLKESKVTSLCQCGCGSPTLTVDKDAARTVKRPWPTSLPEDAEAFVEGIRLTVMLFVDPDRPGAAMEYVWWTAGDKSKRPGRLPRRDELEVARQDLPRPGNH